MARRADPRRRMVVGAIGLGMLVLAGCVLPTTKIRLDCQAQPSPARVSGADAVKVKVVARDMREDKSCVCV